jgi:phosphotransferase system  glucose/maltose/N-acetylglucosamine-specific IIC component
MKPDLKERRRISVFSRVSAGMVCLLGLPAIVDSLQGPARHNSVFEWIFFLCLMIAVVLLFGFVAISGKQPKYLAQFQESADQELERVADSYGSNWAASQAVAIVTVGVGTGFSFFFLAIDYAQANPDKSRFLVYSVSLFVWFVVNSAFCVYARHRFRKVRERHDRDPEL